jgi:hypothetical protein
MLVRLKEFIKEHLINIPMTVPSSPVAHPVGPAPVQPQSPQTPARYNDPGAMLAGLL